LGVYQEHNSFLDVAMNAPLSSAAAQSIDEALRKALSEVSLDDKYTLERGRAFMSGTQALVRLPMLQRLRDKAHGLNTAGFVSGYRGSPLGALDQALWKAKNHLAKHHVVFQPGLNEDLAATSVWGTQQVALSDKARYDGVFSMWYGKGPGVDRSSDVFKHANAAGSSKHGGVIVLAGDDHGAKSSTLPHQSDHIFKACGLPVFYPATVQEYLDLGLHAWAMSRYSGVWTAMKTVTEVVEASASVMIDPDRVNIVLPADFEMPADPYGLNIRWPDTPLAQEARLFDYKWYAALAYVRANRLNHSVIDSPQAWFGIMTGGKAYLDTRQALDDLGLDEATCTRIGIRLFKCSVVWPLEAHTVREFATGLEEILVVEEKRQLMEYALKEELYNWRDDVRPKVYGKFDEKDERGGEWAMPQGQWLLPAHYELSPAIIAKAIAGRLLNPGKYGSRFELPLDLRQRIEARIRIIESKEQALAQPHIVVDRVPTFCAGCPHNTSTRVPEGSRALAGIGCHYMTTWMPDRRTGTFTQMGGEGSPWIGIAPFVDETHIFANLGDGTYFHSGLLAIRASMAAGVNITYKILYNDAVAMTGGQPVDGVLTVPMIVAQMKAEGAKKIAVLTDDTDKYADLKGSTTFEGVEIIHRQYLDDVQKQFRDIRGCTILVYDQTCASEKRRRRKKIVDGKPGYPDPARRVVINEAVCEGCGDCSVQSSCVAVEPLETELGRKRKINQSACNKDFSCINGFCPSFVTVEGGKLRKGVATYQGKRPSPQSFALPEPQRVKIDASDVEHGNHTYGILVTGVGGNGVVTIGQLLGMAAHLEGKGVSVLDMAGLAQKGGAVFSHVQIAEHPEQLYATRIATGEADLLIGCDLVVSAGNEALSKMRPTVTRAVINDEVTPTSDFLRDPDWALPAQTLKNNILEAAGAQDIDLFEAQPIAVALLGDAIYTNPLLLGYAWQKGWVPLTREALHRAMELNAVSVAANIEAFEWGRCCAADLAAVRQLANLIAPTKRPDGLQVIEFKRKPEGDGVKIDQEWIKRRVIDLTSYQNSTYANRYLGLVNQAIAADKALFGKLSELSAAVAMVAFRLMAYKDEYEVARLYADPQFTSKIAQQFEGNYSLNFYLAPPLISRFDARLGRPRKIRFGSWMLPAFKVLHKFKGLRGTAWDVFGYTHERQQERAWVVRYESTMNRLLGSVDAQSYAKVLELARIPAVIRGYGPVKEQAMKKALLQWEACKL
jgi:indolepyruvate ferredoxin oxidoreductase